MPMDSMQYKPPDDQEAQTQRLEHAKDIKNVTNIDWQDEIKISAYYTEYHAYFIKILSKFKSVWEGVLGGIETAQHRIRISPKDTT